jgi:prephenate dehydrogenase
VPTICWRWPGPAFAISRIGAGDPKLWRDVLLANRDQVLAQSRQFRQALEQLEGLMQANDGQGLAGPPDPGQCRTRRMDHGRQAGS